MLCFHTDNILILLANYLAYMMKIRLRHDQFNFIEKRLHSSNGKLHQQLQSTYRNSQGKGGYECIYQPL